MYFKYFEVSIPFGGILPSSIILQNKVNSVWILGSCCHSEFFCGVTFAVVGCDLVLN